MPEILHKCVEEVMGKGHSEQSAYAICRASMGLAEDGTQDASPPDLPDAEMRTRVLSEMTKREFGSYPVIKKRVPLCEAVGDYLNGDQEGALTLARFRKMVENFQKHPRQVPVYLIVGDPNPEHPTDLDARLADGWIEGLSIEGKFLMGDMKVNGPAAIAVIRDGVRGASIGSIQGKSYSGDPIGEVLEHVVLTNSPFVKGMNIAASRAKGGEQVRSYFTALKEAEMAEEKSKKAEPAPKADEPLDLTEKLTAAECLLQEKDGIVRELTASNANLLEEVQELRKNTNLNLAQKRIDQLERNNQAEKVRRITAKMRADGQISREALQGWYDNDSDEVVLAGFKNSQFKGKLDLLNYHRESVAKKPIDRTFISGSPADGEAGQYTAEEQKQIRDAGKDPELLAKTRGAKNFTDYKQRKAAAEKG